MYCASNSDIVKVKNLIGLQKWAEQKKSVVVAVQMKWDKEYCSSCLKMFTDSPAAWLIQDIRKQWPQEICS